MDWKITYKPSNWHCEGTDLWKAVAIAEQKIGISNITRDRRLMRSMEAEIVVLRAFIDERTSQRDKQLLSFLRSRVSKGDRRIIDNLQREIKKEMRELGLK